MIKPISISDTSFQGCNLRMHNKKKIARKVFDFANVDVKNANLLKGVAKTPVRLAEDNKETLSNLLTASAALSSFAIVSNEWTSM